MSRGQISGSPGALVTWGDHELYHGGITQFRVGSVMVTVLDTAVSVTFSAPLPDSDYEVFFQPKSSVNVITFASALRVDGFTMNLSVGVNATFSYLAVGTL